MAAPKQTWTHSPRLRTDLHGHIIFLNFKNPRKDGKITIMNAIVINDCRDANASMRQNARISSLIGGSVNFVGVTSDLEASGNLIDALDAFEGREGLILANVAPRNGDAKKWSNGTPFGYFVYEKTIVVSSISGYTLSLVRKLNITKTIQVFPPETIFAELGISEKENTQFRSYELTPKIALAIIKGDILTTKETILEESYIPKAIWWKDNFGNLKTNLLEEEVKKTDFAKNVPFYPSLKDVPDKERAIVVGSSGISQYRFCEIVINGSSAGEFFGLKSGSLIS